MAESSKDISTTSSSVRYILGLIADYETVIGFLLAGIGEYIDAGGRQRNYMIVDDETPHKSIQDFYRFLCSTKIVGVVLIGTEIYQILRPMIESREKLIPIIVEIPSRKSIEGGSRGQIF